MATTTQQIESSLSRRLSVLRVTVTTSLAAVVFLALCWIGARIGFGPGTHAYISLFSGAEVTSVTALLLGLCWSFFGGAVIGAIYASIYNVFALLER